MMRLYSALFARILSRNRDVYFLKVATLAVAFAASIVVILFSIHEFGYDTHHKDADHLFRVLANNTDEDYTGNRLSTTVPQPVLENLRDRFSDSVTLSRVKVLNNVTVIDQSNHSMNGQRLYAADPTIANIFSFDMAAGSLLNFSSSQNPVAIASTTAASRYFGDRSAVGETLRLTTFGDTLDVLVVAVFNDFPSQYPRRL